LKLLLSVILYIWVASSPVFAQSADYQDYKACVAGESKAEIDAMATAFAVSQQEGVRAAISRGWTMGIVTRAIVKCGDKFELPDRYHDSDRILDAALSSDFAAMVSCADNAECKTELLNRAHLVCSMPEQFSFWRDIASLPCD
jgi:hypothetical protein